MESILENTLKSIQKSEISFCKYITANDTGTTGGHQYGFHIAKNAWPLFFESEGQKGENKEKFATINWQNSFETDSRFIYYGVGTRNEYRLTRFGRGFPYLAEENTGNLLIISKISDGYYEAFILQSDEDIEDFFAALNISPLETNRIIPKQFEQSAKDILLECFRNYIGTLKIDFPTTLQLANQARNCFNGAYKITQQIIRDSPDREILNWLDAEFQLFKLIENDRYNKRIQIPFNTVEELIETANTILNRRKSRAGKSLEHHLAEIFNATDLSFSAQAVTEDNKKPDFIFPNVESYLNPSFSSERLTVLAAKTTCKDRWRQIINEADRVKTKHLFTLQQGISKNQLEEMYKYNVCLVVPKPYLTNFPLEFRDRILPLDKFIRTVFLTQE